MLMGGSLRASLNMPVPPFTDMLPNVSIENRILAVVDETSISVLDIKKKMDLLFHKNYPHLLSSEIARFQFYQSMWKTVLEDTIHTELILLDAREKEVEISKGDLREQMVRRFGPSVIDTLEDIGMTYADAEESIKKELTVQRMLWFYVNQRALQNVHPIDIRKAYQKFAKTQSPIERFSYRIISVKGENSLLAAEKIYAKIRCSTDIDLQDILSSFESSQDASITVSDEFTREAQDIAKNHLALLKDLSPGSFSPPFTQNAFGFTQKILYLKTHEITPPPSLQEKYETLRYDLVNLEAKKHNREYITKLKNTYFVSDTNEHLPDTFQPFVIH